MKSPRTRRRGSYILSRFFLSLIFVLFLAGGVYSGSLFYFTVKDIVAHAQIPSLPNLHLPIPPISGGSEGSGEGVVRERDLPVWEKKERVNILLLGVDKREGEHGPWRTDTIILGTIDPKSKTAGMLSIPRDLWVPVPGYGENRLNSANFIGDRDKYPGGGPALAMKTVEYNFGVPVHYYVLVDFDGFEKIIDTIGGIDVNVERTLHDEKYPDPSPDDPNRVKTIHFEAGLQHMGGKAALEYARSRKSTSDFDRSRRQMQIVLAVREQALRLNLIPRVPELMVTLADTVQTDLQPGNIITLARLAGEIEQENLKSAVIDYNMTVEHVTPNGAWVLLPIREKIRPAVEELFTSPTPPSPPSPQPQEVPVEQIDRLAQEGAKIVVQNGTPTANLDAQTAAFLKKQGYHVVEFSNADRFDYPQSIIIDYTGKEYTIQSLAVLFNVTPENIRRSPNLKSEVDIRLIVGQDFVLPSSP
ncbi:MAG: LytR family transcriptional regulator [Anaerolineales bacterium]|nr:MAG: LytR family transcriptional regulator [Anaerolineales bacterium]